jgi:membrane fusion protein, heavy metal efflux system
MPGKRPYRAWRLRAACLGALAALAFLSACGGKNEESAALTPSNVKLTAEQRQHIHLYTLTPGAFRKTLDTTGAVDFDADQATSVLAPFSGPVAKLLVQQGDQVKAGDALAVVDSPDFATAISTYRKAIATAQTDRHLAEIDQDLLEHKGISEREAAQAQTDAVNAEADREAALQALVALQVNPQAIKDIQAGRPLTHAPAVIRSPVAGTVVERLVTPGQLLEAGTTACFTVADLSRVWVMAQLFGADPSAVSIGDPVQVVTGSGGASLPGKVDKISDLVDPDTRAVAVRVVADNPGHVLRKQMYVRALIQARAETQALLVPVSAVLHDDENLPFVYRLEGDGSFARVHVTVGYRSDDRYEITEGLKAGEQVVVEGGIFMQFMQSQ